MIERIRFTEDQSLGVPKETEAGAKTEDLSGRHGVCAAHQVA